MHTLSDEDLKYLDNCYNILMDWVEKPGVGNYEDMRVLSLSINKHPEKCAILIGDFYKECLSIFYGDSFVEPAKKSGFIQWVVDKAEEYGIGLILVYQMQRDGEPHFAEILNSYYVMNTPRCVVRPKIEKFNFS